MRNILNLGLVLVILLNFSNGERIYKPPSPQPQVSPQTSYAAAAGGSNKLPVTNNNGNSPSTKPSQVAPIVPPAAGIDQKLKQGAPEYLPQNLTFVLSARNLKSKSVDPVIKVSNSTNGGEFEKLGKTEELDNNGNPDFQKVFSIIWKKGTQQKLKIQVRDVDLLRPDDPLGEVTIDLDDYVAKGEKLNVTLQNGTGTILIQKTSPFRFQLYGRALPNADSFGKSDPYVEIYWSIGSDGKKTKWASSAVIDNEENPDWKETFEFANYMKGTDQWLSFKVFDKDPTGSDLLGEATLEIDPFVQKRQTKMMRIGKTGTSTLAITPAP